jgi:hypothetical protein
MKKIGLSILPALLLGAGMTVFGTASAKAAVVYNYEGNDFSIVASPYTTDDKITASLTWMANQKQSAHFPRRIENSVTHSSPHVCVAA